MYAKNRFFSLAAAVLCISAAANADIVVVEGFENSADPADWRATSPPGQTQNAANPGIAMPFFSTSNVTEGSQSGEFRCTWTIPGVAAATNDFVPTDPLTFWSIRYNVNAPTALPNNTISTSNGVLVADLFNNNPYPISISLVCDTAASGQLERGPLVEIPANSAATYTWDLGATPPVGWVTGNGSFDGAANARLKTVLLYTTTAPTDINNSFFIDNIRNTNAQTDLVAPAVPMPYAAVQGAGTGKLTVSWKANTDPDLAGYKVYMTTDATFSSPTMNRLTFPGTTPFTAPAGATSLTIDVPTDDNVFVQVRAFDNATPVANESEGGVALGARLRPDGSAVQDHVILDYDAFLPGTSNFSINGYLHGVCYNGIALEASGRYYDSATAWAIDANTATLQPSASGITIWSNLLDGQGANATALTDQSVAALTTFYNDPVSNLLISGAGLAEDLNTRGAVQQTFLSTQLKASLVNGNINVAVLSGTAPLDAMGPSVITNAHSFENVAAVATLANDELSPLGTAVATGQYEGSGSANAGIVHDNKVVLLGYAFESAASATVSESATVRANLMNDILEYLSPGSSVSDWTLY